MPDGPPTDNWDEVIATTGARLLWRWTRDEVDLTVHVLGLKSGATVWIRERPGAAERLTFKTPAAFETWANAKKAALVAAGWTKQDLQPKG